MFFFFKKYPSLFEKQSIFAKIPSTTQLYLYLYDSWRYSKKLSITPFTYIAAELYFWLEKKQL